jgi:hypothetical protein
MFKTAEPHLPGQLGCFTCSSKVYSALIATLKPSFKAVSQFPAENCTETGYRNWMGSFSASCSFSLPKR